jgi:hypothetical protein
MSTTRLIVASIFLAACLASSYATDDISAGGTFLTMLLSIESFKLLNVL